jgi:hypothetical protein
MAAPDRFIARYSKRKRASSSGFSYCKAGEVRTDEEIGAGRIDTTYGSIEVPQANLAAPGHLLLGV